MTAKEIASKFDPDYFTYFRFVALPFTFYFQQQEEKTAAIVCFGLVFLAAMSDIIDGKWARWTEQTSSNGKFLDALADKVFSIPLSFGMAWLGLMSWLVFILCTSREVFITLLRRKLKRKEIEPPSSTLLGQSKTWSQMIMLMVATLPYIWSSEYQRLVQCTEIFVHISLFLTIYSGAQWIWRSHDE
jgi:CDP-diacylglycerol--glycerol-3-phosphate 3-phosphatidyltransferase